MATTSISEAREQLADLGNRVSVGHERIIVERRGKHLFALVPMEDLELLEQLEDRLDLDAIRAVKDESSEVWEDVKKQLGL